MSVHAPRAAGALALTLLLFPLLAHADPDDQATVVVTANITPADAPERRPGGTDTVAADEFENRLAVSLRDVLALSPGVYTQPRFGQEIRLSIRGSGISRGFHMRGLTLLQDGIPINLADDNGDFQELDPQVFERVEVFRGANALRFGGSTLGGAINAVTPTGRSAAGLDARFDGGSFDTLRGKLAYGFATPRGDAWLAVTGDRSDGDRGHASRESLRVSGNVGLRLSDTVETRFYAAANHIDQDLPGALTRAQALSTPKLSLPANIANDQERDIDSIRLQNRTTVTLDGARLALGGYYNAKQLFHPIFQVIDQKGEDRGLFASADLAGDGILPWELTVGTQARFGTARARQFANVAGNRGALTADARQRAQTINTYGELRLKPLAAATVILGGIHTHGERRIDNRLAPARSGRAEFDAFAPKFGVLVEPAAGMQFYANYSRSVELPGFSELSQVPASGLPGFVAVAPQRAWTAEIGARGSHGVASFDISLYRADIRGELLQFNIAPDIPASTFNADRTRHQGIEAGLDLVPLPWLRLRQTYQLNDFRFRGDARYGDNRLPVIPRHLYRGELGFGRGGWEVTPRLEWVPRGAWADYVNSTRAPGYVLLGLGARAAVTPAITAFLDVRNLAGRKAIGDIGAVVAATPASVIYYPVERRAAYAGLRASF